MSEMMNEEIKPGCKVTIIGILICFVGAFVMGINNEFFINGVLISAGGLVMAVGGIGLMCDEKNKEVW